MPRARHQRKRADHSKTAAFVQDALEELDMTQTELADALGVAERSTVGKWAVGIDGVSLSNHQKIEELLLAHRAKGVVSAASQTKGAALEERIMLYVRRLSVDRQAELLTHLRQEVEQSGSQESAAHPKE